MPEDSTRERMAASTSSSSSLPILGHPPAILDNTTASVVLTHDRQKDRTAKPSLSSSQLARHSEGAIDARCTLSRRMRAAGYVPLPHSHSDALIPLVDTPMNPPPSSPLAIAHLTLSAATPPPIQEHPRSSPCGLGIPNVSPSVFTSEDMNVNTLASCPLHGDGGRPTWATSPCFCDPLEVQALFESTVLPLAGESSQDTSGGAPSTGSVTAASASVGGPASTRYPTRSTPHLDYSFPVPSLAGNLITPSTSVFLLSPKGSDTRSGTGCSGEQEYVQDEDEMRDTHSARGPHINGSSKTASLQTPREGKDKREVHPLTPSCCRRIDTVSRAICSPGCIVEVCCCRSLRRANDTNV